MAMTYFRCHSFVLGCQVPTVEKALQKDKPGCKDPVQVKWWRHRGVLVQVILLSLIFLFCCWDVLVQLVAVWTFSRQTHCKKCCLWWIGRLESRNCCCKPAGQSTRWTSNGRYVKEHSSHNGFSIQNQLTDAYSLLSTLHSWNKALEHGWRWWRCARHCGFQSFGSSRCFLWGTEKLHCSLVTVASCWKDWCLGSKPAMFETNYGRFCAYFCSTTSVICHRKMPLMTKNGNV